MAICYPNTTNWGCISEVEYADLIPAVKTQAEMLAWMSLERLTGYRLALCPITIRPCAKRCVPSAWETATVSSLDGPYISGGRWYNACGCGARDLCSCTTVSELILPGEVSGPINVTIDGVSLDPADFRVDNGNRLVRTDGGTWPLCQDMTAAHGAVGSFTVTYYNGVGPDDALNFAAGLLAVEWYKACQGKDCALPNGVTNVVRQGISFQIPTGAFDTGFSGIRAVDDIVAMYNPHRLTTRPQVLSPDQPKYRQRTA